MTSVTKNKTKRKLQAGYPANGRFRMVQPQPTSEMAPLTRQLRWPTIQPWQVAVGILGLAAVITTVVLAWQPVSELLALVSDQDAVSTYLQGYGMWGPLVLALTQLLQVLLAVIPGHVFVVAAGYVYGLVPGFLLNWIFVGLASQLAFSLARWAGRPFIHRLASPQLVNKWQAIAEEQGFAFFTIAFLLPVFPTDVMNFVAGLTGMSQKKFLAANLLGRMPGILMLTLIGSHGLELPPMAWAIMGLIVAGFYVAGRLFVRQLERRYRQKANAGSSAAD